MRHMLLMDAVNFVGYKRDGVAPADSTSCIGVAAMMWMGDFQACWVVTSG